MLRADGPSTGASPCKRTGLGSTAHGDAGVAPRPPRHLRRTAAESRAAMLHGCARRGSGTCLRLLLRSVLMVIGPNSTPSSAQVMAKPASSCAIVASEALASPRPYCRRGHQRSRVRCACAPSVTLREDFLVADAFIIDVSGTGTDPHKRPCSGSTVHSSGQRRVVRPVHHARPAV